MTVKKVLMPLGITAACVLSSASLAATSQPSKNSLNTQVKQLRAETKALKKALNRVEAKLNRKTKTTKHVSHTSTLPYGHFVTVTTSPFMGKRTTMQPYDLLSETSSMNEDLTLLERKQALINALKAQGSTIDRPIVQVSGGVEGQLYSNGGFGTSTTDGVSLSSADLEVNALASQWASAFMSLSYDNSPISSGNRAPNGKIYLKRGFATIGNLNVSPIYGSIGLMYVPFGRYYSGMLSTPLTTSVGRIRSEAVLIGAKLNNGLFGSVYGFSGSQTTGGNPVFKQGGVNLGFKGHFNAKNSYEIGAGWVSNIADAEGQQNTGLSTAGGQFGGFAVQQSGQVSSNNNLVHRVGGVDAHGRVGFGPVILVGEYVGAVSPFNTSDLRYNGRGAEPKAMHVEVDYKLPCYRQYAPALGLAYGETWQALALNLPKNSYSAFLSASFIKDTIETIEYRHDVDYATSDTAWGRGQTAANITGTGRTRNTVTAQIGVYF